MTAGAGNVIVEFPDEFVTGADMEWNFVNIDDESFFRILLQAKRVYGDHADWRTHHYKELFRKAGSTALLQAQVLCDAARTSPDPTYPLYIFYNPALTCELARKSGERRVEGITLADGFWIEGLAVGAHSAALRKDNRSVGKLASGFFHLSDIFCPPTIIPLGPLAFAPRHAMGPLYIGLPQGALGFAIPPTPHEIYERLVGLKTADREDSADLPMHNIPEVGAGIPEDVRDLMVRAREGRAFLAPKGRKRIRIVFVSRMPSE